MVVFHSKKHRLGAWPGLELLHHVWLICKHITHTVSCDITSHGAMWRGLSRLDQHPNSVSQIKTRWFQQSDIYLPSLWPEAAVHHPIPTVFISCTSCTLSVPNFSLKDGVRLAYRGLPPPGLFWPTACHPVDRKYLCYQQTDIMENNRQ